MSSTSFRSIPMFASCVVGTRKILFVAQTRAKSVLGFLHDIVLQTARRLDTAAKLEVGDPTAVITPFATRSWDLEFKWSDG